MEMRPDTRYTLRRNTTSIVKTRFFYLDFISSVTLGMKCIFNNRTVLLLKRTDVSTRNVLC